MELADGRIVLRNPVESDAADIADAVAESYTELSRFMPWATPDYSVDDALDWVNGKFYPTDSSFVIRDRDGRYLGTISNNHRDPRNHHSEIGYWVRTSAAGRGIATSAARLVAGWGFEHAGYISTMISMSTENPGSRRVAEKLGATHVGMLRSRLLLQGRYHDAYVYELLASEYRSQPH